jgi:hypothetical protein
MRTCLRSASTAAFQWNGSGYFPLSKEFETINSEAPSSAAVADLIALSISETATTSSNGWRCRFARENSDALCRSSPASLPRIFSADRRRVLC